MTLQRRSSQEGLSTNDSVAPHWQRFTIADLLLATFWASVVICLGVAGWHTLTNVQLRPEEQYGKLSFLIIGAGIALGGWFGGFRWPGMGMLLGGVVTSGVILIWLACRMMFGLLTVPIGP